MINQYLASMLINIYKLKEWFALLAYYWLNMSTSNIMPLDSILQNKIIIIPETIKVRKYKCLPDTVEGFNGEFITKDNKSVQNMNL